MPKTARTILEAALAALDDDETETSAEALARMKGTRGDGHNDPMRRKPEEGEAVSYPTDLARVIAQRERYLAEQEDDS